MGQLKVPEARALPAFVLLGVLFALASGCATAKPVGPKIDKLELNGNSAISDKDIKEKILTTESSWLPSWVPLLGSAHYFDASAWAADLRRIERYYQTQGYYRAKVVDDEVVDNKPGHVTVKVQLEEGKPAKILEVNLEGLEGLPIEHQKAAVKGLPLHQLAIFKEADWQTAKDLLVKNLKELGYAEATLEGEAEVDELLDVVRIHLEVTPRQRYKFGQIFIATGQNPKVPNKMVEDQVKAAIKPGAWYQESQLTEAQAKVFALNVFALVKVNRGAPDQAKGEVPIVVDVREAPFHTVRAGVGFGIDQLRDEARVTGEYTDRNFFGGLRRLTVKGKAGWAFLPDIVSVATGVNGAQNGPIFSILTEFEQPHFLHRNLSFQTSLELNSGLEPAYRYIGGTYKIGLPWRPYSNVTIFPSYNLDVYFLSAEVPLGGEGPDLLFGCPATCIVSYLEQTFEWDRRDNRLEPKSGTYLALSLQEGGGPLGGAYTYLRIMPEVRGYVSWGHNKKYTIAARVKAGTLLSNNDDSPIIARFFSGGNSMRGFASRRLSPMLVVQQPNSTPDKVTGIYPAEAVPIGGKGLLEASIEFRYNIIPELTLAIFVDSGAVTWESLGKLGVDQLIPHYYVGAGIGIRYITAFGPIRVDFGARLPIGGPQQILPYSAGVPLGPASSPGCLVGDGSPRYPGSPEGICALHLSIGEAF